LKLASYQMAHLGADKRPKDFPRREGG
jgi:hypothetical protein